jgi:uncharacterized integral membrane protein
MAEDRQQQAPVGLIVAAVIVVLVLVFALQNSESTEIRFLFFTFDSPLIFVIIGAALLGATAGAILRYRRGRRA